MPASFERGAELSLLSAVLAGDHGAGTCFYQRYNPIVERSVRRVLRHHGRARRTSADDVRDLVGEVWLSLLEENKRPLRRFDPRRKVRVGTWIGLLARHKAIDRLRATPEPPASLEEGAHESPAPGPALLDELVARERQEIARRALAELRAEDRSFLEAWYGDEDPGRMAARFGVARGTLYTRRFKIQAKLGQSVRRLTAGARPALRPAAHRSTLPG